MVPNDQAQRLQKLKKFNSCSVHSGGQTDVAEKGAEQTSSQCDDITVGHFRLEESESLLSVSYEEAVAATQLPKETAEGIWKKAAMLITELNAITFAAGFGSGDRMWSPNLDPPHT